MTELTLILVIAICLFILYLVNCKYNMNTFLTKSNFASMPVSEGSPSNTQLSSVSASNGTMDDK